MKNKKLNVLLTAILFVALSVSCSKEKKYQSKLKGTWDIYKVENTKNYYTEDSIALISTIENYGVITFTKEETQTTYQTKDVAYIGSVTSSYLPSSNGSNIIPFQYEIFVDYIIMHGGLIGLSNLYFEFDGKKEMTLVIGQNSNPGGTAAFAYQTTYYFRKK